jgi:hypothetical protein
MLLAQLVVIDRTAHGNCVALSNLDRFSGSLAGSCSRIDARG